MHYMAYHNLRQVYEIGDRYVDDSLLGEYGKGVPLRTPSEFMIGYSR